MFKASNPFDEDVTAATSETLTKEDWELITTICERADKGGEQSARECVAAIQKRLLHRNPNVQGYALTLSNALVRMCGINVHKEISSRTFTQTLTRILQDKSTHEAVKTRILDLIQEWSNVFRSDDTLGLMEETMNNLRSQNFQFPSPEKPKKELTEYEIEKQKKEEEEQIQMAMALSLSSAEVDAKRKISSTTTTTNTATSTPSQPVSQNKDLSHTPSVSRVKALYDFIPTESGELGFSRGDVITVLDSVYKDWWRGELRGKTGIFPVNYVEKLPEPTAADIAREAEMEAAIFAEGRNIDQLLELLAGLDPTSDSVTENDHIQNLYNRTLPVRPKLMKLIEKYSQRKDDLIALHKKFIQAITTYDRLMAESLRKYEAYMNPTPQHQFNYPSATPSFIPPASGHGYFNPQQHFQQINQQSQPEKPSYQVQPQYPPQQYPPQDVVGQLNAYQQANQQANQQPPVQSQQDNVNQQPLNYPAQQSQQTPLYPQVQQEVVGQIAAYQQQQASQQPQQIPAVQPTSQFSSSDNVGNQMISSFATPTPLDNTLNSGSTNYKQETQQQQLYPSQNTQESSNQQPGYYQPSIYSNQQTQPSSQPPIQQPPIQQPPIQQPQQNQTGQTNYPPNSQSQFQTPFSGQYLPVDGPGNYQIQPSTSPQPEINTGGQPSVNHNAYSNTPPPNSNSSNSSYSFNDASYQPTTAQQPQRQATLPPHVQHQQPISLAQIVQHVNEQQNPSTFPSATQQQQQYPQQNYYNPSQGAPSSYGASVVKSEFVQ